MRNIDIKDIYNTFLRISRKRQNKPYKLRTNFDSFEETEQHFQVQKLKRFFDRNYTVNIEDFFNAPYEVYEDLSYYDLDFYSTLAAVKVYNLYCNKISQLDPDNQLQVQLILRGVKFIEKFCIDNNIPLGQYLNFKLPGATTNSFLVHLKEKNISPYNLFAFKNFDRIYSSFDFQILRFILNDLPAKISIYRGKFYSSKTGKKIATTGLKLIEKNINKTIEKSKK